jgi:spore cortex biosynthesis protein YabQ
MDISIQQQVLLFLYAGALGVGLSIIYDFFRVLRLTLHFNVIFIFIQDLIYFLICAIITFAFIFIFNNGEIRLFIIAAIAIGWILYYLTAGRLIFYIAKTITSWLKKHIKLLLCKFNVNKTKEIEK